MWSLAKIILTKPEQSAPRRSDIPSDTVAPESYAPSSLIYNGSVARLTPPEGPHPQMPATSSKREIKLSLVFPFFRSPNQIRLSHQDLDGEAFPSMAMLNGQ